MPSAPSAHAIAVIARVWLRDLSASRVAWTIDQISYDAAIRLIDADWITRRSTGWASAFDELSELYRHLSPTCSANILRAAAESHP